MTEISIARINEKKIICLACNVFKMMLLLPLMSLALAKDYSTLELSGIGSVGHRGSFQQLLREATPIDPCYQNLVTNKLESLLFELLFLTLVLIEKGREKRA
ncbi:hypothetical protein BTVI_14811 [Pitangus sulphuratus]|nr:hypothetical protein BTVI_14811 [Pitangus sulphuratus]